MKNILICTLFFLTSSFTISCGETDVKKNTDSVQPDTAKSIVDIKALPSLPLQVSFPSIDGLVITGESYFQSDSLPWILLCHQAGYSRGEYKETAPEFVALGYNCLAIDLRSGDEINGVKNETAARARAANKSTTYLDAEQDIIAAVNYLYEYSKKPVVIVGSSYSAGLALKVGTGNPLVKAILAFSPGEYYGKKLSLAESIKTLDKPVFITSALSETKDAQNIFESIPTKQKMLFTPTKEGVHASSCLWKSTEGHEEYWSAIKEFLAGIK